RTPDSQPARHPPGPRCPTPVAVAALLWALTAPGARGAPLYLSPQVEAAAGATSNRFLDSQAEASPYLRLTPALVAVWFGPVGWEAGATLAHSTTRFTRPGFEHRDETTARGYVWHALPIADLSASVEGGMVRDGVVSDDDTGWLRGGMTIRGLPGRRLNPGLAARLTRTRYESRTTSGGSNRTDTLWSLDPDLRWQIGRAATLWTGATLEGSTSNAEDGSYRGFGLDAGLDVQLPRTADAGLWARWQERRYDDGRVDNPTGAGAWGTLRLSSWAELTANAHYLDHRSISDLDDYREWGVEAGVRLRYDWPLVR
ncbi:MAG: hypothetical protein P1P84_17720, partial [Deferrisomatales bacterium]|nr:hypothetical protein [Deferrisomatales bacterium]